MTAGNIDETEEEGENDGVAEAEEAAAAGSCKERCVESAAG